MKTAFPLLETKRTRLRNLELADCEQFYHYYNNPELYRFLDWSGPRSIEHAKELIEMFRNGYS